MTTSPAERKELQRRISEPIYEKISELVVATGWTYACEEDVVSAWKEIARLSGFILTMDEDDPHALYLRGRSSWRLSFCSPGSDPDSVDDALSDLNRALSNASSCGNAFLQKLYNERGLALMRMSGLLFKSGDVEAASKVAALAQNDFTRVIGSNPNRGSEASIVTREVVEATLSLGWLHYFMGAYEKARHYFLEVSSEKAWPSPPTSPKERAESLRALGLISYRSGKQMFHQAEASGERGEYEAAGRCPKIKTSLAIFVGMALILSANRMRQVMAEILNAAASGGEASRDAAALLGIGEAVTAPASLEGIGYVAQGGDGDGGTSTVAQGGDGDGGTSLVGVVVQGGDIQATIDVVRGTKINATCRGTILLMQ